MPTRIKHAEIEFISLVPLGANLMPVLYKSAEKRAEFRPLVKADDDFDEKGELLAVVYAPEYEDAQGDRASPEVIKEMAHSFMRKGGQIDIRHDGKPVGTDRAFVAENFLIQKGDERFADWKDTKGNPVDVTGGWAVILKIEDPDLRELYREGAWNGVSMAGPALLEEELEETPSMLKQLIDRLAKLLGKNTNPEEEIEMDKAELEKILDERDEKLVEKLTKAMAPASDEVDESQNDDAGQEDTGIEFEGDRTNPEDVAKHLEKVKLAKLAEGVDFNDPEAVAEYAEALAKMKAESSNEDEVETEDETEDEDDPRVKYLEQELEKARRASRAPAPKRKSEREKGFDFEDDLEKTEQSEDELGEAIAEMFNPAS